MKPPPFEHVRAGSVEEAVGLLARAGGEAKVLAGGQSLLPLLNLRLARPALLVDVNRAPGLDAIEANSALTIGALARQADALVSPQLAAGAPLIAEALRHVGHPATRNRGTVGGSVAHADRDPPSRDALAADRGRLQGHGRGRPDRSVGRRRERDRRRARALRGDDRPHAAPTGRRAGADRRRQGDEGRRQPASVARSLLAPAGETAVLARGKPCSPRLPPSPEALEEGAHGGTRDSPMPRTSRFPRTPSPAHRPGVGP
jgi:hypothetical protein